ncbi:MAG: hypothetical protein JXQ27_06010 [Acidobacteria bacterium]|nr:hypothetical protein [Acidobacteriota bacterium]
MNFRWLMMLGMLAGLLGGCSGGKAETMNSPQNADDYPHVGMTLAEFRAIFPAVKPDSYGQWPRNAELHGLAGGWTYTFQDGRLQWFLFDVYERTVDAAYFDRCLQATRRLMEDYRARYGEPADVEEGTTRFRDPGQDHHWGYPVLKASWITAAEKIRVSFQFKGSHGDYYFLVKVEHHDRNDPLA